jgi:hypothetical protein
MDGKPRGLTWAYPYPPAVREAARRVYIRRAAEMRSCAIPGPGCRFVAHKWAFLSAPR